MAARKRATSLFFSTRRLFFSSSRNPNSNSRFPKPSADSIPGTSRSPPPQAVGDLRTVLFRVRFPRRSATEALERWVREGGKVKARELSRIATELKRSDRCKHALEVLTWMEAQPTLRLSPHDRAKRLELIAEMNGLAAAEDYFEKLNDSASKKTACVPLLHCYVKEKNTGKAEAFMRNLQTLGFLVTSHPFIEMMKLYASTGHFKEVLHVIQKMRRENIPHNVLSYNLSLNAAQHVDGISAVEKVYKDMIRDKNVTVGWSTLATMANIYASSSLYDKALSALKEAECTLSTRNRLGYFFLITSYANLNDKDGVLRVWESSKKVEGRITSANYMCILLCLVKVNNIEEAERVFKMWESESRKYDIRVSNVLLGAYVRKGWFEKAESFHMSTLAHGGVPNYKTWEILMEAWVKSKQMDKAVDAMKKGFSMLKCCHWRPPSTVVMAIAEHFDQQSMLEDAIKYVKVLSRLNAMSLPLYKTLLRMHIRAQMPAPNLRKMMEKGKIDLDEETNMLIEEAAQVP